MVLQSILLSSINILHTLSFSLSTLVIPRLEPLINLLNILCSYDETSRCARRSSSTMENDNWQMIFG